MDTRYIPLVNDPITYPIKLASQRSGLTAHVIRIWEKRYAAISPQRTASGRRLYSEGHIERLSLLRQSTRAGHPIGQIAHLSDEQLRSLVAESAQSVPPRPADDAPERDPTNSTASSEAIVERCMDAVQRLDSQTLEGELRRAALQFDHNRLISHVIEPFMATIGQRWRDGSLRIASEHLASVVVRSFIDTIRSALRVPDDAPHLLVTTPLGQMHELGALFVATMAATEGWRTTYLGSNIAADDIAAAAYQQRARAVALSIVYSVNSEALAQQLHQLRQRLGSSAIILAGGAGAAQCRTQLQRINAIYIDEFAQLRPTLSAIRLSAA